MLGRKTHTFCQIKYFKFLIYEHFSFQKKAKVRKTGEAKNKNAAGEQVGSRPRQAKGRKPKGNQQ